MRATEHEIRTIISRWGVLAVRDHPDLRRAAYQLLTRGILAPVLPGVLTASGQESVPEVRIAAAALYGRGIVTTHAAARLTFWPKLPLAQIRIATPVDRRPQAEVCFERRAVPPEWLWRRRGITVTKPALTAVDLIPDLGGTVISEALRAHVPMDDLWQALEAVRHRRGHAVRRRALHAYRGVPCSEAEQQLHTLMRAAHLSGWLANYRCTIEGITRYLDVVFPLCGLVIEVDGYASHQFERREQFELDRFTSGWLSAHGWRVLRFTWRQIVERPEWVIDTIRRTIRLAEADGSSTQRARMAAIGR